jgi:glycosyltransferase involved in cell wall biosynthesis
LNHYPKISIVTPAFNRADYLEETILSILNQKYPNLEYIIIDGGSTDGTLGIIKKYEKYLTYWISEPDNGMYCAIRKGFNKSTGEIMAWINADDKYQSKSLFAVAQIFSDLPDVEWILGMSATYSEDGICVKVSQGRKWSESRFYIGDYRWIQQESVFWKRSLWARTGNDISTSYKYAGDFELWCRFFQHAKLFTVSTIISGFRSHRDQLSILYQNEYETEVMKIIGTIKPKASDVRRYNWLKRLWKLRNFYFRINSKTTKYISILLTWFIDKIHRYPAQIYYDFTENKWKK